MIIDNCCCFTQFLEPRSLLFETDKTTNPKIESHVFFCANGHCDKISEETVVHEKPSCVQRRLLTMTTTTES